MENIIATDSTQTTAASDKSSKKSFARHLPTAARLLLGFVFFFFGLNGFLNFLPPPSEPMPEAVVAFSMALMSTKYMFPLIKGTEVLCGALLLSNRFVPLALAMLAPVVVNIVAVHLFLAPSGLVIALVCLALLVYLAWSYRSAYRAMLAARVMPG
jgi:uncharacterized membrane protein YphA (DoxX/SURF4 family)